MTVAEWIAGYGRAWEEKDADGVAALFTEDAIYRDEPFGEPHHGHDGVRAYWTGVTSTQEGARVRFGTPAVGGDGRHVAVEFWVTMKNFGTEVTLTGILFLRLAADGRCEELREAWHFTEGLREPPTGWGQ
jgi:SnoaL-like domain